MPGAFLIRLEHQGEQFCLTSAHIPLVYLKFTILSLPTPSFSSYTLRNLLSNCFKFLKNLANENKVTNPNINESEYSTLLSNTFIYSIVTDIILSR